MAQEEHDHQDEVRRLRRAVEELSILNELARAISISDDSGDIIRTIVRRSMKAVKAEQANITMVDREEGNLEGTLTHVRTHDDDDRFHLGRDLAGMMFHHRRALVFNNISTAPELKGLRVDEGVRNLVCVPLMVGSDLIGVLIAFNKAEGRDFSTDDQRILAIIGSQSAQILENTRQKELVEAGEEMRQDVELAHHIQEALLPGCSPEVPGYDICGTTVAAKRVGGDYFDFIPLPDQRWAIALGDVSGKGIPASLLMANLQATLRSQAHTVQSCHEGLTGINRMLFLSTTPDKFATLFYCLLDTRSHILTYCNAGHEQPFLFQADGQMRRLDRGGLAVGILEEFDYEDDVFMMQPGDMVVIFSDGVTDMNNAAGEYFGEDRLRDLAERSRDLPAQDLVVLDRDQGVRAEPCQTLDEGGIVDASRLVEA
jgi:sigma-B regulation protein RsbU (phosphoserine phosphatase)